jgi:hypothetical protein
MVSENQVYRQSLTASIRQDLHRALKLRAVEQGCTMTAMLEQMIAQGLARLRPVVIDPQEHARLAQAERFLAPTTVSQELTPIRMRSCLPPRISTSSPRRTETMTDHRAH